MPGSRRALGADARALPPRQPLGPAEPAGLLRGARGERGARVTVTGQIQQFQHVGCPCFGQLSKFLVITSVFQRDAGIVYYLVH